MQVRTIKLLVQVFSFAAVWLWASTAQVMAANADFNAYYIDEPVFGGQAYILEAGQRSKPAVVLVHGLNDSTELWRPFIPALARDFHVITFDLPGFGRSDKGNKLYSPENYVAFIRHVLNRFEHKQIRLVGHSLGGNIALHYASTYPQQVERLALVSVAGVVHRLAYTQFLAHFGIRNVPEFYREQNGDLKSLADRVLGTLTDNASLIEFGEKYMLSQPLLRENLLGGQPPAIAAHAMMLSDVSDKLFKESIPTLLIWGGDDLVTTVRTGKLLAANFANAGLAVLDGVGHVPMRERPERVGQLLAEYLTASPQVRDAMLAQYRYTRPVRQIEDAERIGRCENETGKVFRGTYKLIVIENCRNVRLERVHADSVSIVRSDASIEASVIESTGKALLLENSDVVSTATVIKGQPALILLNSKLDMAGGLLHSETQAIMNSAKASTNPAVSTTSRILFSLSRLDSKYVQRYLHGPMTLQAGQGM